MPRLIVLALLAACPLAASDHRGLVKFGGLPVPGVTVTASQGERKFVAVTDADGAYSFADLPDGAWDIRVEMLCFEPIVRDVAVSGEAPPALWELHLLPFDQIQALAPPPAKAAPAPAAAVAPAAAPKADFQRTDLNAAASAAAPSAEPEAAASDADMQRAADGFLINGSSNNGAATPFAQSGAFGNNRRNGRSLYTGGIGVILDNSALDARSFSLTGQATPKPAYNHMQGVVSFGGPVNIPHLIPPSQRPANFFIGYQWTRNRNASTQSALMPTEAQRAGDFSQQTVRLIDPTNGIPFPGSVLPASRITPQATSLLGFYPLPNFAQAARYNYQIPIVGINTQDALQSRLNKTVSMRDQLFGSFAWQRTAAQTPNLFAFTDRTATSGIDVTPNWTHRFGQRIFAHLKYDYTRASSRLTPYFANRENVSAEAGITGNNQDPVNWGPPTLSFAGGIAPLGDAQASFNRSQTSALSTDIYWNHRSHNITFGGDFKRQQMNLLGQQNARGSFTFTGAAAGSDFAGFLLGVPDTSSIAFGNADKYFRAAIYDAYVQDDWRVGPGLTLNIGMRWEYWSPITELYGRLVNLDIAPGFAAEAPVVAANPVGALTGRRYPDSLLAPNKHGFEPRLGLSWRPMAGSSMVVRAGYGVNHNTSVYTPIATQMAQQAPLSKSLTVANSAADPLTLANGFVPSPGIVPDNFGVDPNMRLGYSQSWQLSVQRDLPMSLVMTATYLGIKGTRAQQMFLPDTYPDGAVNPCSACQAGYAYLTSNGNSTRESGQLQLRRRLHSGLGATLQYTYSKAIDDAALGGRGQSASVIAQNWLDLAGERGLSPFDERHQLNLQMQYSTGMGGSALVSGFRGLLFKGWTVLTNITAATGLPETPSYLAAVAGTGVTGSIRPEYTGASLYAAPAGLFLNPAAYAPPPSGQWGNAGRATITGPAQFTLNASLARTFRLNDRFNADLRFDATNALNHVTYTAWNTAITNAEFGLPIAANAMRSMQATLRVRF